MMSVSVVRLRFFFAFAMLLRGASASSAETSATVSSLLGPALLSDSASDVSFGEVLSPLLLSLAALFPTDLARESAQARRRCFVHGTTNPTFVKTAHPCTCCRVMHALHPLCVHGRARLRWDARLTNPTLSDGATSRHGHPAAIHQPIAAANPHSGGSKSHLATLGTTNITEWSHYRT